MPTSNDPDRYALVIEGVRWEYTPQHTPALPWKAVIGNAQSFSLRHTDSLCTDFPTHAPAILDIVAKWHEDRMPRVRRRVVECEGWKFTVTPDGAVSACSSHHDDATVRELAGRADDENRTPAQVRVMADLIANPDEPEPNND